MDLMTLDQLAIAAGLDVRGFYERQDGTMFHDIDAVGWRTRMVGGRWGVVVPTFMDQHGWVEEWEVKRFASMAERLKPGMTFVDVGAYDGWQDAIIAGFVGGGENMVLVEPEPTNWPNIRETFRRNGIGDPKRTYMGLIGPGETTSTVNVETWPEGPDYTKLISHTTFRHLDENAHNTAMLRLDSLLMGQKVDAINVDVEGAGLLVLQSAERTLREQHPLLWVSVHGTEIFRHRPIAAQFPPEQGIQAYLEGLGYKGTLLDTGHEEEWEFV